MGITFLTPIGKIPGWENWEKTAGIGDDGEVYLPALIVNQPECLAYQCALHDGVKVAEFKGHFYFPVSWALRDSSMDEDARTALELLRDKILARN